MEMPHPFPKISVYPIIRLIRDSDNGETNQNHRFYGLMDFTDGDASSLPKNQCLSHNPANPRFRQWGNKPESQI